MADPFDRVIAKAHLREDLQRMLRAGLIVGGLAWLALAGRALLLAAVLWIALEPTPNPEKASVIPNALARMHWAWAALWLFARVLGSSLIVPVVEELAFRGYLLRRIISADFMSVSPKKFTLASFLVSSVVFGFLHGRWVAGILAGMIYAIAQYRRGEITDAIVAHATTNALLAAYVVFLGHWSFW